MLAFAPHSLRTDGSRVSEICNERTAAYIRDLEERLRGTYDREGNST